MSDSAYFLIEPGPALDLLKSHIAERQRVLEQNRGMLKDLGVENGMISNWDGKLTGALFPAGPPEGWGKPRKDGSCRPKKGTDWYKRFEKAQGYTRASELIATEFSVPLSLSFQNGWTCIGSPFNECGFLWMSLEGPYAMWVPDVPTAVAKAEAEGSIVAEPAKSFRLEFKGCKRILKEEWEMLVLSQKIKEKLACQTKS